jgi:hypothetical protein
LFAATELKEGEGKLDYVSSHPPEEGRLVATPALEVNDGGPLDEMRLAAVTPRPHLHVSRAYRFELPLFRL